eukprot:COSAG05_NODE_18684_length_304_cov_1.536585_2_plen_48_part_01
MNALAGGDDSSSDDDDDAPAPPRPASPKSIVALGKQASQTFAKYNAAS